MTLLDNIFRVTYLWITLFEQLFLDKLTRRDSGNDFCRFLFLGYPKRNDFVVIPKRNDQERRLYRVVSARNDQKQHNQGLKLGLGAKGWMGVGMEIGVGQGLRGRNLADERYTGKEETTSYTTFHVFVSSQSQSAPEMKVSSKERHEDKKIK